MLKDKYVEVLFNGLQDYNYRIEDYYDDWKEKTIVGKRKRLVMANFLYEYEVFANRECLDSDNFVLVVDTMIRSREYDFGVVFRNMKAFRDLHRIERNEISISDVIDW